MSERSARTRGFLLRRTAAGSNLALFLIALATVAIVVNYFAYRPWARIAFDATKTRAYSLSPRTKQLLADLEGSWTIALIMVEDASDDATRQQVEQVLERYREASPAIAIRRVDPTDPATFAEYEALLAELRGQDADRIVEYESALDDGVRAFEELQLFALRQSGQLQTAVTALAEDDPRRAEMRAPLALLGLLGQDGRKVLEMIDDARAVGDTQPIADYETARSILARALGQWANELYGMAGVFRSWRDDVGIDPGLTRFAGGVEGEYRAMAQRLAIAADPLQRLPVLEVSTIGRQLEQGEAAVIIGPERSAVIPSAQLFPKLNVRAVGEGAVAFDRRFRGEQVISAAIRSLRVPQMPMVVFVHGEPGSLLRADEQHADLLGVATLLDASRFVVREWQPGVTDRPVPAEGQAAVWIVLPPLRRETLEPGHAEIAVLRAAEALIEAGEPVLVSVHPSLLPRYRQPDPWQRLGLPFGLRPDTARAIFEEVETADGAALQLRQTVHRFEDEHAICGAVHGQMTEFPLPVVIESIDGVPGVTRRTLVAVEPGPRRWLEADWATRMKESGSGPPGAPFETPLPIVVAARRKSPGDAGEQRFILAGSGGWLYSNVADRVQAMGGDRVVLLNPGNQEMLLASVAWLAGMDDLIAPGPVSRQVARLDDVGRRETITWGLVTVIGAPALCLLFGGIVGLARRL